MPYSSCCLSLDTAWASTRLYLSSAARSTPVTLCCSKKRQLYQTPKRRAACAGNTVLAGSSQHLRPIAAASRWAPGVRHCRPPARKRRAAAPRCSTTDTAELQGQLDGRIWTLLVPAIAAVFFDPLMALTDTGMQADCEARFLVPLLSTLLSTFPARCPTEIAQGGLVFLQLS